MLFIDKATKTLYLNPVDFDVELVFYKSRMSLKNKYQCSFTTHSIPTVILFSIFIVN